MPSEILDYAGLQVTGLDHLPVTGLATLSDMVEQFGDAIVENIAELRRYVAVRECVLHGRLDD